MKGNKLYVGNLNYSVTNDQLQELFGQYGEVASVNIIEGKGFGFVEMSSDDEAKEAIKQLNGKDLEGRAVVVNEARPQERR